jgi:GAF domain-containing protein
VSADRLVRILTRLSIGGVAAGGTRQLCEVAAEVAAVTGAGIMLAVGNMPRASLCTTDRVSSLMESLQYTLGEGPCVDAHTSGFAVYEPDLASPQEARWPAFAPPAVDAGARAVFGFPLRVGSARLGALNLYRDRPGPLSEDQQADALVMADVAARAILTMQRQAAPGEVATALETNADFNLIVHQAAGVMSIQLESTVADALSRLRSHAFRTGRLVGEVAADVVSHRIRFDGPDDPE